MGVVLTIISNARVDLNSNKPTTSIFYCSQSALVFYSRPLENNRHNLVEGIVFEIQDLALRARS